MKETLNHYIPAISFVLVSKNDVILTKIFHFQASPTFFLQMESLKVKHPPIAKCLLLLKIIMLLGTPRSLFSLEEKMLRYLENATEITEIRSPHMESRSRLYCDLCTAKVTICHVIQNIRTRPIISIS